jgi:hypothetical protein
MLSEHLICSDSAKYVTVFANRSTKAFQPGRI